MAIEKNEIITAADIVSLNASKVQVNTTNEGKGGSAGDDSRIVYSTIKEVHGTDTHDASYWNFMCDPYVTQLGLGDNTVTVRQNDKNGAIVIKLGEGTDEFWTSPAVLRERNTSSTYWKFYLPPGTYYFEHYWKDYFGFRSGPKINLKIKQSQTGMVQGDVIRVWDSTFDELLPEGSTLVTAALAKTGRLGYE